MLFQEIHREIEHNTGKIHLILHFSSESSTLCPPDSLRQEIRAILGSELLTQLQCRKQKPADRKPTGPECTIQPPQRTSKGSHP